MKSRIIKHVVQLSILAIVMLVSCAKEEQQVQMCNDIEKSADLSDFAFGDTIIMHSELQSISKNYLFTRIENMNFSTAYHIIDKDIQYKVLKVPRSKDRTKYFYIMVENLNFKTGKGCWAYDNNEKNVEKYGRLYTWGTANSLAREFYMILPVYVNGEEVDQMKSFGRLPKMEDILDIIAEDTLGHLPEYGHRLVETNRSNYYNRYYDIFITGIDPVYDLGNIPLFAGVRHPDSPYNVKPFKFLNEKGLIWLRDGKGTPDHEYLWFEPIKNDSRVYDCTMFNNAMTHDSNGCSVRLVFEPEYIEE